MNQPYSGLATGMTPNPIQAILNPQPAVQPQQAQGQGDQANAPLGQVGQPMPSMASPIQTSMARQTRGFNNTPTSGSGGTPGKPGRPPVGMKKTSSKCNFELILQTLKNMVK